MSEIRYEKLTRDRAVLLGPALLALNADSDWENWTLENLLADRPEKWQLSWLASSAETPIGYAIVSWHEGGVHLHRLVVGAARRGSGVGRRLLWCIASYAQDRGAAQFTMKVHQRNQRAIEFYKRCGFQGADEEHGEYTRLSAALDDVLRATT